MFMTFPACVGYNSGLKCVWEFVRSGLEDMDEEKRSWFLGKVDF